MDLDMTSELPVSPSIDLSASLSSPAAVDVFSLLVSQVQQCHTQQMAELQQKLHHRERKCQKLMRIAKERGEVALRYRQSCHQLREENHVLKRCLQEDDRRIPPSPTSHVQRSSSPTLRKECSPSNPQMEKAQKENIHREELDISPPSKSPEETNSTTGVPKRSRLTLKKRNRKVRYDEVGAGRVSRPSKGTGSKDVDGDKETDLKDRDKEKELKDGETKLRERDKSKETGLKGTAKERRFVPETMDPDLGEVEMYRVDDYVVDVDPKDNEEDARIHREKEVESPFRIRGGDPSLGRNGTGSEIEKNAPDGTNAEGTTSGGSKTRAVAPRGQPTRDVTKHLEELLSSIRGKSRTGKMPDSSKKKEKLEPQNTSTPVNDTRVTPNSKRLIGARVDVSMISPVGIVQRPRSGGTDGASLVEGLVGDVADSANTQMSPTFAGDQIPGARTAPLGRINVPASSSKQPSVLDKRDLSPSRTFDLTGESDSSILLLPQGGTPSGYPGGMEPSISEERSSAPKEAFPRGRRSILGLKRKLAPDRGGSKKAKKFDGGDGEGIIKGGIRREFTPWADPKRLEDQKQLRQSTMSQHFTPSKGADAKFAVGDEGFKTPVVPGASNGVRASISNDETNMSFPPNGALDPIIVLDDSEGDAGPPRHTARPRMGTRGPGDGRGGSPRRRRRSTSGDSRAGDESGLLFEDSFDDEAGAEGETDIQNVAVDFDRVPRQEDGSPQFKHKEVVRKRGEREKLKGFDCKQCAMFYDGMQLTDTQKEERMNTCSRHRGRYTPPNTPEHYWSVDFPDTQTCLARGYIHEDLSGEFEAMPRRRNRLKQLFPAKK